MLITMRRVGAAATGTALVLSALAVAPSAHAATYDAAPLGQGVDWITGRMDGGLLHTGGFPDYSGSLDTAFALQAIGGHATEVSAIRDAVGPNVVDGDPATDTDPGYAISNEFDWQAPYGFVQKGYYAGSIAKALVFAQSTGVADITAWAGTDLVAALEDRVSTTAPTIGRISDDSSYGDFANTIGAAFAARGLTTAGSADAASVTSFLLDQQCAAGWFRLDFTADLSAADQSCDADPASKPDPDVTSFVLLELAGMAAGDATVSSALDKASTWLATRQQADGSFGGGTSTEGSNANSTGLAGWALGERGNTAVAERAARWVRTVQAHEPVGCTSKMSAETGAIAYDPATLAAGRTGGIANAYQWQLSTAQSLPVLRWLLPTSSKPVISGPTGYQPGASTVAYRVTGAVAGDPLCVGVAGARKIVTAGAAGAAATTLRLPAATTNVVTSVADHAGVRSTVVTKVLGAARPPIKLSKARLERGRRLTVRISGLAAGERVTLKVGRKTVRTGTATTAGAFSTRVKLTRKLVKPGKVKVTVVGQFANRTNSKTLRVVR